MIIVSAGLMTQVWVKKWVSQFDRKILSLVELLEPFARLTSDVTIKDPEGLTHPIPNLSLTFQDFYKDPCRDIGPRLLSDTVASITEEPLVSRAFPNRSLQLEAPGFTPWFDAWTKIYLQVVTMCFGFLSFETNHVTQLTWKKENISKRVICDNYLPECLVDLSSTSRMIAIFFSFLKCKRSTVTLQRPRTDLNKKYLTRPKTTTA